MNVKKHVLRLAARVSAALITPIKRGVIWQLVSGHRGLILLATAVVAGLLLVDTVVVLTWSAYLLFAVFLAVFLVVS